MDVPPPETSRLPRPFYDRPWPASLRPHAKALWHWHLALADARLPAHDAPAFAAAERDRVAAAEPVTIVPDDVWRAAYAACRAHHLPLDLLAQQVEAAGRLHGPVRFETNADVKAFVASWAHPHARLLAHLADAAGSWQLPWVDELATGFFWVGRIVYLPDELALDRLFIPLSDLEQAGVSVDQLREGRLDENVRKLLWKQEIRAQDAIAQGERLAQDLPRRYAAALKRCWFGGLEVLNEVRRRGYDVWSKPVTLSLRNRVQAAYQARFGRTTFRS